LLQGKKENLRKTREVGKSVKEKERGSLRGKEKGRNHVPRTQTTKKN